MANQAVQIQAIGVKEGNRLLIAGEEVELRKLQVKTKLPPILWGT
jgi:hypothetical protein